jgi:hypothetical protein
MCFELAKIKMTYAQVSIQQQSKRMHSTYHQHNRMQSKFHQYILEIHLRGTTGERHNALCQPPRSQIFQHIFGKGRVQGKGQTWNPSLWAAALKISVTFRKRVTLYSA